MVSSDFIPRWQNQALRPSGGGLLQTVLAGIVVLSDFHWRLGNGPVSSAELLLRGVFATGGLAAAWDLLFSQGGAGWLRGVAAALFLGRPARARRAGKVGVSVRVSGAAGLLLVFAQNVALVPLVRTEPAAPAYEDRFWAPPAETAAPHPSKEESEPSELLRWLQASRCAFASLLLLHAAGQKARAELDILDEEVGRPPHTTALLERPECRSALAAGARCRSFETWAVLWSYFPFAVLLGLNLWALAEVQGVVDTTLASGFERLAEVPLRLLASAVGLNYDRAKVAAATGAGAALLGPSALVLLFELSSLPLDLLAAERHFLDFQEIVLGAVEDVGRGSARPLSDAAQEVGGFAEAMFPQPATGVAQSSLGLTEDRTAALLAGLGSAARAARWRWETAAAAERKARTAAGRNRVFEAGGELAAAARGFLAGLRQGLLDFLLLAPRLLLGGLTGLAAALLQAVQELRAAGSRNGEQQAATTSTTTSTRPAPTEEEEKTGRDPRLAPPPYNDHDREPAFGRRTTWRRRPPGVAAAVDSRTHHRRGRAAGRSHGRRSHYGKGGAAGRSRHPQGGGNHCRRKEAGGPSHHHAGGASCGHYHLYREGNGAGHRDHHQPTGGAGSHLAGGASRGHLHLYREGKGAGRRDHHQPTGGTGSHLAGGTNRGLYHLCREGKGAGHQDHRHAGGGPSRHLAGRGSLYRRTGDRGGRQLAVAATTTREGLPA